jgi:hypothetical protein
MKKEIIEGNKLIAEFMGAKYDKDRYNQNKYNGTEIN